MTVRPESEERHEAIRQQFAARSPVYEDKAAWIPDPGLLDSFVTLCRVGPDAVLLDVCCGSGLVGGRFRGRVARLVGLDLTPEMLDKARERLDEVHLGPADRFPFPDATFDLAVCRQALHFVDSPAQVVREMFRVLRPGGQAIVGHRVPYGPEDADWWARVNAAKQPLLRNLLRAEDLHTYFEAAGFVDRESLDYLLEESIRLWTDSPEAREGSDEVFRQYSEAPPEVKRIRQIRIDQDEVRDVWRWHLVSGRKPG